MKNKLFSDNKKGSKGFYAALGISAVMIGSACYFAYDQGEKLTREMQAKEEHSEAAVDRQVKNIPRTTTAAYKVTTPARTMAARLTAAPVMTTIAPATIPAAAYIEPADVPAAAAAEEAESVTVSKLEHVKAPLSNMDSILGPFSGKELVKSETTGSWQTHNGTDIAAEVGAEVYAVSNGEVSDVISDPVWGVTVVLDHHNGFVTRYCGLSEGLDVQKGDQLVSGDIIGTVGNTADIESAIAPHLHIELLHNGKYIDPLSEIK